MTFFYWFINRNFPFTCMIKKIHLFFIIVHVRNIQDQEIENYSSHTYLQ